MTLHDHNHFDLRGDWATQSIHHDEIAKPQGATSCLCDAIMILKYFMRSLIPSHGTAFILHMWFHKRSQDGMHIIGIGCVLSHTDPLRQSSSSLCGIQTSNAWIVNPRNQMIYQGSTLSHDGASDCMTPRNLPSMELKGSYVQTN